MPRIDNLQFTTDFDTLKNDDSTTATITIPASDVIAASTTKTYETSVAVGAAESLLLVSYNNNNDYPLGDYSSVSTSIQTNREGTVGGVGGFGYSIVIRFAHSGGNIVRLTASIFNNNASPLTLASTADIYTFRIRSFKVPRFS